MLFGTDLANAAQLTLQRLLPRLDEFDISTADRAVFSNRLEQHFPRAFGHLYALYSDQYDFFYHLQCIFDMVAQQFAARSADLKTLDKQRVANPDWFLSEQMVGGVAYVDLFAGDLHGVREKIPYFKELDLTYLHLMPLFAAPEGNSDGGYAVSDYRTVNPTLGTMDELAALTTELRANDISLVLDFVFNHTSDEHTWARRALAGDAAYQAYYRLFPDRTLPDQYEQNLREIFPDQAPGNFTYNETLQQWVWTTFNRFQWDLNYANPAVFTAMLEELLFLANQGVEVLRLDAVAFVWKQLGTNCENLPQAHWIIRAFNAFVSIAAPALIFKSEAIVHPDFVDDYIAPEECQISYNPTLMALLWEALATREVKLLRHSMSKRFDLPPQTAWVNYVRVHDDIGWSFADEDAAEVGIDGFGHRQFLNQFYTGKFSGSFATGLPFNYNPVTQDMRISGTCASLAGLEQALDLGDEVYIEHSLRRILLIHAVILSVGGIPLLYLGDEIATTNDHDYRQDPAKQADSRWVHRPFFDWERAERRNDPDTAEGHIFQNLLRLIHIRKTHPVFQGGQALFFDSGNPHVLSFSHNRDLLMLANFSENEQTIQRDRLRIFWQIPTNPVDLSTGDTLEISAEITLEPYQFLWLLGE